MEIDPAQLKMARIGLGLTARAAATSVHVALRTWQCYEAPIASSSFRPIPAGLLELFCLKHAVPYPSTRLDGSSTMQGARVISILSGTGGSGKTPITLELARAFAKGGKRTTVVTDSSLARRERLTFENPRCIEEQHVALTEHEAKGIRMRLRDAGAIDVKSSHQLSGVDLFIHQGELNRLEAKEAPLATLSELKTDSDLVFLDISQQSDIAVSVSDIVIFIIDLENHFSCSSAINIFGKNIARIGKVETRPMLFCLLTNKMPTRSQGEIGNHHKVKNFGPRVLNTILSTAHARERREILRGISGEELRTRPIELLVDKAPNSIAAFEYYLLANELLVQLGEKYRI
ncbi:ParA family protein [Rugamonas sp. A1-17]|nr:ParA family protein [Rugamonas sp. A1-17]